MIFHFFDRDGGGSIEMEEMVRALYDLRDTSEKRDLIGGVPDPTGHLPMQSISSHTNTSEKAWGRNQYGQVAGGSASKVTIFAPNGAMAASETIKPDPIYHLKNYRNRREYLYDWKPSDQEREYIDSSVVYNPQNVARQQNLVQRNAERSVRRFDKR